MKALFHSGFYTSLDGWHNIARIYHYSQAINDGQFPPRWVGTLANGYGYPLFIFSYHAPWLMAQPILGAGFDYFVTLKAVLVLGFIGSGLIMYGWLREFLSKEAALAASIIYLWTPYRFSKILVGASVGEATVFLFLPLFFWGLWGSSNKKNIGYILIGALGLFGIINSHFILLPLLIPLCSAYSLYLLLSATNKKWSLLRIFILLLLGLGLSSFYLIPLFAYHTSIAANSMAGGFSDLYKNNLVNFSQLLYSKWGYGPITTSAKDGEQPLSIGFSQWGGIFLLTVWIAQVALEKIRKNTGNLAFLILPALLIGVFLLCVFLMINFSLPLWNLIEKIVQIDYPWRNLAITTFVGAVAVGLVVNNFKKISILLLIAFVFLAVLDNRNHLLVNQYTDLPLSLYLDSETTTNTYAEYLPNWVKININKKPNSIIDNQDIQITNIQKNSKTLEFIIKAPSPEELRVNYLYFPGQVAHLNGKETAIDHSQDGRIYLSVPEGVSNIKISFEGDSLTKSANLVSVFSLISLVFLATVSAWRKSTGQTLRLKKVR